MSNIMLQSVLATVLKNLNPEEMSEVVANALIKVNQRDATTFCVKTLAKVVCKNNHAEDSSKLEFALTSEVNDFINNFKGRDITINK